MRFLKLLAHGACASRRLFDRLVLWEARRHEFNAQQWLRKHGRVVETYRDGVLARPHCSTKRNGTQAVPQ